MGWEILAFLAFTLWLTALTLENRRANREVVLLMTSLRHVVPPERQIGGRSASRRRTDFRVPVELTGYVRVLEHAKPCRVIDVSRTGAQVVPVTGTLPIGEHGVLTIEFSEFGSASTHIKVIRYIEPTNSYGVRFMDSPHDFYTRCTHTVEGAIAKALAEP